MLRILTACLILLCSAAVTANDKDSIRVISDHYYPCAYETKDKVIDGYSYRLAYKLIQELDFATQEVQVIDWLKSFMAVQSSKPVLHICLAHSPHRAPRFQWAGPIWTDHFSLYKAAKRRTRKPISQLKIGCVQGYVMCEQAQRLGYSLQQIVRFRDEKALYSAFADGRIALLLAPEKSAEKKLHYFTGRKVELERLVATDFKAEFYFTFSLATDPKLVAEVQAAVDRWQQNGYLDRLKSNWQDEG